MPIYGLSVEACLGPIQGLVAPVGPIQGVQRFILRISRGTGGPFSIYKGPFNKFNVSQKRKLVSMGPGGGGWVYGPCLTFWHISEMLIFNSGNLTIPITESVDR